MVSRELLKYFVASAEMGSFSAAANALGRREQNTMSTNIARMEDGLNVVLFDRSGKYPSLTDVGIELYHQAKMLEAVRAGIGWAVVPTLGWTNNQPPEGASHSPQFSENDLSTPGRYFV